MRMGIIRMERRTARHEMQEVEWVSYWVSKKKEVRNTRESKRLYAYHSVLRLSATGESLTSSSTASARS